MSRFLPLLVWIFLAGCSAVPFQETAPVSMEGVDPAALLARFRDAVPERFRTMSSVVFEFAGKRVAALGVTEVDLAAGTFTSVAMNPMGVKLFELSGAPDGATSGFLIEAVAQGRKGAAQAIGDDIRRVYFGLLPGPGAKPERSRDRISFRTKAGAGTLVHVFAGADGFLVEKDLIEDGETVWKVRYYEYRMDRGKAYPRGIVLDNVRRGYRLIIRVKEIAV